MPKYQLGNQLFYRDGVTYPAGSTVTLQGHIEPSRTWRPLDKAAEDALAKLRKGDEQKRKLREADLSKVPSDELPELIEALAAKKAEHMVEQLTARFERRMKELEELTKPSEPFAPSTTESKGSGDKGPL